jgi:hypothetical protein
VIGLLDAAKIAGGIALGALIATPAAHYLGKREGRQEAAVAALETAVKDFTTKGKINGQVFSADAASLCADLGLPDDEANECMRRLREASAEP